ncbi:MFS transporter [Paenibacillus sp. SN-8-1]|uniref:MFS transporter n=1 Tax=Paenibacillus sp. SN-8-1 TaxID=3435409 RepID=UPI003D9A0BBF
MSSSKNYSLMILILCWSGMVVMSSLYVTIPLTAVFANTFGITLTHAAEASSGFSIGFAIGCLFYGPLSEKYGRKPVIVIGLMALTVLSLLLGLVNNFTGIVLLRSLQGAAAASFSPVALAYTVAMFPATKRVTAIGFISTGFLVAGIVGQVTSGLVSQVYNWNAVFIMLFIVYTVTLFLVITYLPREEHRSNSVKILDSIKRMPSLFKQKNLVLSYVIAMVLLMSFVSMYTVLGSYLAGPEFGLGIHDILYIRSIGIAGMLISPFAGKLVQRFGVSTVLRWALTVATVSLASLGFSSNLAVLIVISVFFVAGIAVSVPALISLIGQLGGKSAGIAVSVYTVILFTGTSLGPILSIRIMEWGSFALTFLMLAIVLGIGLLAACLIHPNPSVERTRS